MRRFSTENKAAVDDSEKLILSKRLRGKVRLPPLPAMESYSLLENTKHDEVEFCGTFSGNSSSGTDNLITPKVFKQPMSPSNLSIQFNFDEAPSKPKQLVKIKETGKSPRSRKGHKRLQNTSTARANDGRNGKDNYHGNKQYNLLRNDEKTPDVKASRHRTLSNASVVKSTTVRGRKTNAKKSATFPGERLSSSGPRRLDINSNGERKSSIYDLREFLSLPSDIKKGKVTPVFKKDDSHKTQDEMTMAGKHPAKLGGKSTTNHSQSWPNKPSEDYMYDVFEFLALAEHEKPMAGKGRKKSKGVKPDKVPKVTSTKTLVEESGLLIPSVVVADWSLKDQATLPSKQHGLPKVDFPRDDQFPKTPDADAQRKSVYDLKEFLNMNDLSRRGVAANVGTQKLRLLAGNDRQPIPRRESEAQYDLREFLTFLESRASSNGRFEDGMSSSERPRTTESMNADKCRGRTISVYDIFEFLKATNFQDGDLQMRVRVDESSTSDDFQQSPSHPKHPPINLTEFLAESARNERPPKDMRKPTDEGSNRLSSYAGSSSNSTYNLSEFLELSVAAERSQVETESKRKGYISVKR